MISSTILAEAARLFKTRLEFQAILRTATSLELSSAVFLRYRKYPTKVNIPATTANPIRVYRAGS